MTGQTAVWEKQSLCITDEPTQEQVHFADESPFYKLVWMFALGAFMGFLVETAWCLFRFGHFELRSGLVFGPFNPIYGIGAVTLYLVLGRSSPENKSRIILWGMVAGTVVEYVCSLVQETVFGSVSWDYSGVPLNIGGRVCLLYSVFWGILALLWVHVLQPFLEAVIHRIPERVGKPLTWLVFTFFLVDGLLSAAAVTRWMTRMDGLPAAGSLHIWLDRRFPDAFMEFAYPNMLLKR